MLGGSLTFSLPLPPHDKTDIGYCVVNSLPQPFGKQVVPFVLPSETLPFLRVNLLFCLMNIIYKDNE